MNYKLIITIAATATLLTGCCSNPDEFLMEHMAIIALPDGVQQTQFARIGEIHTTKGVFYVALQKSILTDMQAPRGLPLRILLFSENSRLVATYEANFGSQASPLWCEGSKIYLFGYGSYHFIDSVSHTIPADPRLAHWFANKDTPTGNVIDFSAGPLNPILAREKHYGSSGGLDDDPWNSNGPRQF